MPRPWTVLPHRPIEKLQPNLWTVEADLPQGPIKRRMGIARLADGRLVFLNAIALDEPSMVQIEGWGEPAFAIAGNGFHRIDLGSYKARYPKLLVLAAPAARKRVEAITAVDGWLDRLPKDSGVKVEEVAGTKMGDTVARVTSGGSVSLAFPGDVVANSLPMKGVGGAIAGALGFVGDLRVPRLIKWIGVRDKAALRQHLRKLADTPDLKHIFNCHGPVISQDPTGALRRAADTL